MRQTIFNLSSSAINFILIIYNKETIWSVTKQNKNVILHIPQDNGAKEPRFDHKMQSTQKGNMREGRVCTCSSLQMYWHFEQGEIQFFSQETK